MFCPFQLFLQSLNLPLLPIPHPLRSLINLLILIIFFASFAKSLDSALHLGDMDPQFSGVFSLKMVKITLAVPLIATPLIILILDHLVKTAVLLPSLHVYQIHGFLFGLRVFNDAKPGGSGLSLGFERIWLNFHLNLFC